MNYMETEADYNVTSRTKAFLEESNFIQRGISGKNHYNILTPMIHVFVSYFIRMIHVQKYQIIIIQYLKLHSYYHTLSVTSILLGNINYISNFVSKGPVLINQFNL